MARELRPPDDVMTSRFKAIVAADRSQRAAVGTRNRDQAATKDPSARTRIRASLTNQDLAAAARERAAREPGGSLGRRAWGCLAVALGTTGTVNSARRVLDLAPAEIRDAARDLINQFTETMEEPAR
jgi:hypothetical protein